MFFGDNFGGHLFEALSDVDIDCLKLLPLPLVNEWLAVAVCEH